jgi:hypothetical protein
MSYEDMADQFTRFYTTTGREDFREFLHNRRRAQLQDEQLAVGLREAATSNTGIGSQADWIKYRNMVVTRQMEGDKALITQGFVFTDPKALERQTFYKYTPKALDNIRKSVGAETSRASDQ